MPIIEKTQALATEFVKSDSDEAEIKVKKIKL